MKWNKLCLFALFMPTTGLFAQSNIFPESGNVGIGTTSPAHLIDATATATNGGIENFIRYTVSDAPGQHFVIRNATSANGNLVPWIEASRNKSDNYVMGITASIPESALDIGGHPMLRFDARIGNGKILTRPLFSWGSYTTNYMTMTANGNLGIGIVNPAEKLAVNGTIRAKEVKVETANWPDYVFKSDYKLQSLTEVEHFIQANGHLPDMPKAEQVEEEGLSLGEVNKILVKKMEEMTLYMIQLSKDNEAMKN